MILNLEPIKQPCFSCMTSVGMLTIDEIDQETISISLENRFHLQIMGKINPKITLDSDEQPTQLRIRQTVSQWIYK